MACQLLMDYLDRVKADYRLYDHGKAPTASGIATSSGIDHDYLMKVVMIKFERELAMVVVPAGCSVQLTCLARALHVGQIKLATEREFCRRFPRCDVGAIPPIGHLYGLNTYIAPHFDKRLLVAFSAGSYGELIVMPCWAFLRLAGAVELPGEAVVSPEPNRTSIETGIVSSIGWEAEAHTLPKNYVL